MTSGQLQSLIETGWDDRENLSPSHVAADLAEALEQVLDGLESGRFRVHPTQHRAQENSTRTQ